MIWGIGSKNRCCQIFNFETHNSAHGAFPAGAAAKFKVAHLKESTVDRSCVPAQGERLVQ